MINPDWPEGKCRFMTAEKRCEKPLAPRSHFCEAHKAVFAPMSNAQIIEMNAQGVIKSTEVKEKKIHMKKEPKSWDDFLNSWHELLARGYGADDITQSSGHMALNKNLFSKHMKEMGLDPSWKKLEKVTAAIHSLENEGAVVTLDEKVVGKTSKGERQIDVSVRFKNGFYEYFVMVECKDYSRAVSIDKVEALAAKRQDVGANKAIIVSKKGFQKGARAVADFYEIELFILGEEGKDWTKKVIQDVREFPFPFSYVFDCPRQPPHSGVFTPKIDDFLIRESEGKKPITLLDVAVQVSESAHKSQVPLPCEVYVQFDKDRKPWQILLPAYRDYMPIYGITISLESRQWTGNKREIDIPPRKIAYVYSDVKRNTRHRFDMAKVKKAVGNL